MSDAFVPSPTVKPHGRRRKRQAGDQQKSRLLVTGDTLKDKQVKAKEETDKKRSHMDARHGYLVTTLADNLQLNVSDVEECFLEGNQVYEMDKFFQVDGPTCLMFFYEGHREPVKVVTDEDGATLQAQAAAVKSPVHKAKPKVFLTDGLHEAFTGLCAFFLRLTPKALTNHTIGTDTYFGMLEANGGGMLGAIRHLLAYVFVPALESQSNWGQLDAKEAEQLRSDFLVKLESFVSALAGAEASVSDVVKLSPLQGLDLSSIATPSEFLRASTNPETVDKLEKCLTGWCREIEQILTKSDQMRKEADNVGPRAELEYWKKRMAKFNALVTHVKSKDCKTVLSILQLAKSKLLKTWRTLDTRITESANEAKDNVKFLHTMEKYCDPLYRSDPVNMLEGVPGLINSIRMIHSYSRYYNTAERMTALFVKVTNQMITACKNFITNHGFHSVWEQDMEAVIPRLDASMHLNQEYQQCVQRVKQKIEEQPEERPLVFSEMYVFGKFNTFCQRLRKIKDVFDVIKSYKILAESHIEGIEVYATRFSVLISTLKKKPYDVLDHRKSDFDVDYHDFKSSMSDLEDNLQMFFSQCFDRIPGTRRALELLSRFDALAIPCLDIEEKHQLILLNYVRDIEATSRLYNKLKNEPPIEGSMPPVAGKIRWARQLLHRIEEPMTVFKEYPRILQVSEAKKVVKHYNKLAQVLLEYEVLYHQAWLKQMDVVAEGLSATVFVHHPKTKELFVNFDDSVILVLRETEVMQKLGLDVPPAAISLQTRQTMFKRNSNQLKVMLAANNRIRKKIPPVLRNLFTPHLAAVDAILEPGAAFVTWTSLTFNGYVENCKRALDELELLVNRVNGAVENQINACLAEIAECRLCHLPESEPVTIDEFLAQTRAVCEKQSVFLESRGRLIEETAHEIIDLLMVSPSEEDEELLNECDAFGTRASKAGSTAELRVATGHRSRHESAASSDFGLSRPPTQMMQPPGVMAAERRRQMRETMRREADELLAQLEQLNIESLLKCIRQALESLRKRASTSVSHRYGGSGGGNVKDRSQEARPIFRTDLILSIPDIAMSPSLDDVQQAVNRAAQMILAVGKGLLAWGQKEQLERIGKEEAAVKDALASRSRVLGFHSEGATSRHSIRHEVTAVTAPVRPPLRTYSKSVTENKELAKSVSMLSSAINSTKREVLQVMDQYSVYHDMWRRNRDDVLEDFLESHPQVAEFQSQIVYYQRQEQQILEHPEVETVGAVSMFSEPLKIALCTEAKAWRVALGEACNTKYRLLMEEVFALLDDWTKRLSRTMTDLDDVRAAMSVLREVRESEIRIDTTILPVEESYALLNRYQLPVAQEESDRVDTLRYSWHRLLELIRQVQDHLLDIQSVFKTSLLDNVTVFQEDVDSFYSDYGEMGPMAPGVHPREASDRLVVYQNRFDALWRRHDTYSGGEELFGLSVTDYPDLVRIRKELNLLQKLYGLYNNVIDSVDGYYEITWNEVDIEKINSELLDFQNRCRKLPKGLKDWQAFGDLKKKIDDFNETCPLLEMMAHKAMKPRHWNRIAELTGHEFDIEAEGFLLRNIMEAPLLSNKEDIEDVCIAAVKEQDIEAKLKAIENEWGVEMLHFSNFKNRGELLLRGEETTETVSRMEDSLMILSSLMSNRYNAPFKTKIQQWVHKLSTTTEIIENWLVVQNLWIYLEAVFVGGDIAKQLPKEAKRFQNIDKSWVKIMTRAHETSNVVLCCVGDETLGQLLPHLLEQLELCQKSLSGYLEAKRLLFPRFFFVSDPALLEILGQASDSHTIQAHLLGIFDNVKTVSFHEKDYDRILAVNSRENVRMELEKPVNAHGNVETWLDNLLKMVQKSLHGVVRSAAVTINDQAFEVMSFLDTFIAQVGLLGLQMIWTRDAETALTKARSDKKIMASTDQDFLELLNRLIGKTTEDLGGVERTKYETLITIHVHQRDIFHDLVKMHVRSPTDFEWLKQSRFYFNSDIDKCVISITDVNFTYQNEYLGCTERLVITPLTDRCYITLAQALGLSMGGAPAGPAGTGKTETVKDMGKALGKYVVVFNCSDQMDYRGLGRIYKGLAQSGSWGCFDEFNRIELPVLSVAAQQIAVVLSCKKERKSQFIFTDGDIVTMNSEFGIFLTMNPGYAGRQELPENLKMQFRTVAMMVPDRHIIIRVKLASVGFIENIILSRKFYTLYKLCEEQLTKQVHYDFGLRNILSVLRTLGAVKREAIGELEGDIVMRVLRDMNLSKLVDEDEPLFLSLIRDLFPGVSMDKAGYPDLEAAIAAEVDKAGLVNHPPWTLKLIQLFETQRVRHGMMVLGPSGAGKTCCIHILMKALTDIGRPHREMRMNPKAITASQMFGKLDVATNDWTDGIFSTLWRKTLRTKKSEHVWLVLDGPVDTLWIENLNSVLDDNKTLTLANGDRIPMSPNCKIIFEPHNIDNASPATVSRNGMVYMSSSALDWQPILQGWLKMRSPVEVDVFTSLFEATFQDVFNYFSHSLNPKMDLLECNYIAQAINLLQGLIPKREDGNEVVRHHLARLFAFAMMWSLGAGLELEDRVKLEVALRKKQEFDFPEIDPSTRDTIFEFVVGETGEWQHWKDRVQEYEYPRDHVPEFSSILVPNVDNVRMDFLIHLIAKQQKGVLLMGEQGTAKTVILKSYCSKYNQEEHLMKALNFSSATTPNLFQRAVESYVEKRVGSTYGPPAGRKMTVFIDDINMPLINEWGDQVTNEIVRQLMEMRGFYSLDKPGDFITIADIQFVAATIHPGGGRNDIPQRLKRRFAVFNCTLPSTASIDKIFGVIAKGYFCKERGFSPAIAELATCLVLSTRRLWQATKGKMLSTPAKFHYIFNLRDLSRIWEGMLNINSEVVSNAGVLMALWKHEASRVIADRFISQDDRDWFDAAAARVIGEDLGEESRAQVPDEPYFVDFLREAPEPTGDEPDDADLEAPKIYEPIPPLDELREKLEANMSQYNEMIRGAGMDLVFFKDAMVHLIKISRIIRTDRGNALLVGVGGSGKQSLTRLASFIAGYKTFQITLTRAYNVNNLIEDLKHLYNVAGAKGQGIAFLFTDQEIKDEGFLEYMNNVLSSGEVSNLFSREELDEIFTELTPIMKKEFPRRPPTPDNLYSYFLSRARRNLHVVLCFSPVGEKFRNRALKFPGLISGCTMDWFFRWPKDALVAVAEHFVSDFQIECEDRVKREVVNLMGVIQDGVAETCVDYFQRYRRSTHVTPKSYLSFLAGYKTIYKDKQEEIGGLADRMNKGLEKLVEASQSVEQLSKELVVKEKDLAVASEEAGKVLKEVAVKAREAEAVKVQVQKVKDKAQALVDTIDVERSAAQKMLDAAKPALEEAEAALKTIQPSHISNVRNLKRPPHLIQRIMDCVLLLFQRKIDLVVSDPERPNCHKPSWSEALKMMSRADFLSSLLNFNKDLINDETVDLLAPYFEQEDYVLSIAKRVCADVAGLLAWTKAMSAFYEINKKVLPLKSNLMHQEARLAVAEKDLATAQAELDEKQREKDEVQAQYDAAIRKKEMLMEDAETCRRKMNAATALISGLSGERDRWTSQSKLFQEQIGRLVGDVLLCTGFLSYAGPFNQEYRTTLLGNWMRELKSRRVPFSSDINVTGMLVDSTTVGEWKLQGLPNDELSTQNGIIVTKASRFPLLIDPQGQGKSWIRNKEANNELQVTSLNHKYFRNHLEDALSLGRPLLMEDVGEELDPVLDNVLERNFIKTGSTFKVKVGDKEVDVMKGFRLYVTTKLANPLYTPEISAKTSIIDFTVTMKGLGDQLLGMVILREKAELESERTKLMEDVQANKKKMKDLEDTLLFRLTSTKGSLVDDESLIDMLRTTKATAEDVQHKLEVAKEKESEINLAREEFRPVATRGSILYFLIVEMSMVNVMYQTALAQFLELFELSMAKSGKSPVTSKRILNIAQYLTMTVFRYSCRGLYENHKFLFTLLLGLKIDLENGRVKHQEFQSLIKGGAALDLNAVQPKPAKWILDSTWLNLVELSKLNQFSEVLNQIARNEKAWRAWFDSNTPEESAIPDGYEMALDTFRRLLLIRSWCPDRTTAQARKYISESLGKDYAEGVILDLKEMWEESSSRKPMICFLSQGSDPTNQIEGLAKRAGLDCRAVSMGQGQEIHARKLLQQFMLTGGWALLQNCHLGLNFLDELLTTVLTTENVHGDFRLWMTTEVHKDFPINLLQISIKFTNEPPQGIKAGLKRTFAGITQDILDVSNMPQWKPMLYAVAFLHTTVQERRKFGPLGWNIPYEYNNADLNSSMQFVQNHIDDMDLKRGVSWSTVRYMLGEVHYGGRVTDDMDKRLLNTFCKVWFGEHMFGSTFRFYKGYAIPHCFNVQQYLDYVDQLPLLDSPEVFGLHTNADITYQTSLAKDVLDTIVSIQPKDSSAGGGETRESVVQRLADDMLDKLPQDFVPHEVKARLQAMGALSPMNIFLRQEIDRMQRVISCVRNTLLDLKLAIDGTIIMSENLRDALDRMYDARVPTRWSKISWDSSSLGFWFTELLERNAQFRSWCFDGRPNVFWMTGFFNPQGFLTAMRQEVTRAHKGWALDTVVLHNEVLKQYKDDITMPPEEGVYIHGLFLDGAGWDRRNVRLSEAPNKVLFTPMPVVHMLAINSTSGKDPKLYCCPVYKKPHRTDLTYITDCTLKTPQNVHPDHWTLRGVALLCDVK